tara:strand:- start:279 stop:488 length:210 start_codon:yes stop_codon:yes gene_type:complete
VHLTEVLVVDLKVQAQLLTETKVVLVHQKETLEVMQTTLFQNTCPAVAAEQVMLVVIQVQTPEEMVEMD